MAGYALIDSHLEKVRAGLAHRADVAEVIAELEDHLYSAAERAEADGAEVRAAQEATLARFGDPGVVATAFATNARGGVAVPTSFTRSAGSVALVGAFLWLTVLVDLADSGPGPLDRAGPGHGRAGRDGRLRPAAGALRRRRRHRLRPGVLPDRPRVTRAGRCPRSTGRGGCRTPR